ncbi:hypothetical protein QBC43DRAFT_366701 [Cladorrhinum sp. PSN259]|nr:hypothetical protein QBC43DRAFT_366701 [Cladorrhinum sp. PSN259]
MRKLLKKFGKPDHKVIQPQRQDEILDPKYVVPNPPGPVPPPVPNPGPNQKGVIRNHDHGVHPEDDITTFSGFGSWMASFEPDPQARGAVEMPVHVETLVTEILTLEEGWSPEYMFQLTLDNVKKPGSRTSFTVQVIGPWFMTLAQLNKLLTKHGYLSVLSAKHGTWAGPTWDADKALPTNWEIPVVDGPSRYEAATGEGPLMSSNEKFGVFLQVLRLLRVRCQDGKVMATSFPGVLEIGFNRTLRLPEDGKTHNQPVRLGKISVSNIAGLSKKLQASGNPSLIDMARKGGVFFPLYQREAMFLSFKARQEAFAVRVFVGGVNALSGLTWNTHPGHTVATQDYLSVPPQQYLDGVCVGNDVVRQFIAMPLGSGYSVEKQVTGKETVGGMQLEIIPGNRWRLQIPPRGHTPFVSLPESHETPFDHGARMVVLIEDAPISKLGTTMYGMNTDKSTVDMDATDRPVYLHHLYQSQVQPQPTYGQTALPPPEIYPGAMIRMTAVYMLNLTLQYAATNLNPSRTERVEWAPWWILEQCFSHHEQTHSSTSNESISDMELYHEGRRLDFGGLTLEEQGLLDGALITVRRPLPPPPSYLPHQSPPPPQFYDMPFPSQQQQSADLFSDPTTSPRPWKHAPGFFERPGRQAAGGAASPDASMSAPSMYPSPMSSPSFSSPYPSSAVSGPPAHYMAQQPQGPAPGGSRPTGGYGWQPPPQPPMPMSSPPPMQMSSPTPPRGTAAPPAYNHSPAYYTEHPAPSQLQQAPPSTKMPTQTGGTPQDQIGWAMGLAAGSRIRQPILRDPSAPSAWCRPRATVLSVQILNSVAFEALTGMLAPPTPVTPQLYLDMGLPFLKVYEEEHGVDTGGIVNLMAVGEIDATGGGVQLGASMAGGSGGGKGVGCTCCGRMFCDSILRPCNHAFCSSCIREYMTHAYGNGTFVTVCRICSTRVARLIGFSAPMALPGEDVVDLSEAKIVTMPPSEGASGFQSVHELSTITDEGYGKGYHNPYEMPA